MRITNSMLSNTVLKNISGSYARIEKWQAQLSSGKLYRRPSENPVATGSTLNLRAGLKTVDQHLSNIKDGLAWLTTTDTALRNGVDLLQRAKELAVVGANGTNTQSELNAIAVEIGQIIEEMTNIGNTSFDGRYIFGGNKTAGAPPFTYVPEVAGPPYQPAYVDYSGDSNAIKYEIEKGITEAVNLPGDSIFKTITVGPPAPPPAKPSYIFQELIDLKHHLEIGDFAAISNDTSQIDNALNLMAEGLMTVGAKINRFDIMRNRLEEDKLNLTEILSGVEDADMAEVITRLKMEENVYQAALATGANIMQKSLIDFLK